MKKPNKGKLITCCKCGYAGYTLVKVSDNVYQHQTPEMCLKAKLEAQEVNSERRRITKIARSNCSR